MRPGPFRAALLSTASRQATAAVPWWHPSAVFDLDYTNSRFRVNGVNYASIAAMVAAGIYVVDPVGGDRLTVSGIVPTIFTMFFAGTTSSSAAPAASEMAWCLKGSGTASQNRAYAYRNATTAIPQFTGADGSGTVQWDLTGAAMAASTAVSFACRLQTNNIAMSFKSGAIQTDSSATVSAFTTLYVGNRNDGSRSWNGTIGRVAMINETNSSRELERMNALFFGLDHNAIYNAIQEPFQMVPNLAQMRNGLLHVAYATSNGPTASALGSTYIGEIDVARKRLVRERSLHDYSIADEHLCPAWLDISDGSSIAVGTGHNTGSLIYWRQSATGTLAGLSASETQYSSTLHQPNYVSLVERTPTEVFMLTNEDKASGTADFKPNILYEKLNLSGGVWAATPCRPFTGRDSIFPPVAGAQNQLYYVQTGPSASVRWNFGVAHDSNDNAEFRVVETNLATGDVITRSAGGTPTTAGNMLIDTSNTVPIIDHDNLPKPFTAPPAGKKQIELIIVDSGIMAMVQEVDNATDANSVLWLYKLNSGISGNPFSPSNWTRVQTPFGSYYSDAEFSREVGYNDGNGNVRVFITWHDIANGIYKLERWDSADGGATWGSPVLLMTSSLELRRPVSPVNCTAAMPVICCEYVYRNSYDDFSSRIVWP